MHRMLVILPTAALMAACSPTCGNDMSATVLSPSGKMKAVVFNRNCGATTGFNTQVSILSTQSSLPNTAGNVLAVNGEVPLSLNWESDDSLQIAGLPASGIYKQEQVIAGVRITIK